MTSSLLMAGTVAGVIAAAAGPLSGVTGVNIIDGADGRGSILELGPGLGLSTAEIFRIRSVSGYVGCLSPSPSVGGGALFLTDDQILTAAHIIFEPSGTRRSDCFFRPQLDNAPRIDLLLDTANARYGAVPPRPGSNNDYAVVRLATPLSGYKPFPVDTANTISAGDELIVVSPHPVGMEHVPRQVPVAQGCRVRRVPVSTAETNFYRTDCDATGSSSGGMHLSRVEGRLVYRGFTISTGPWRDPQLDGAPYDEHAGSVTTALATDAAILNAGLELAIEPGR